MEGTDTATAGSGAKSETMVAVPTAIMDIREGTGIHVGTKGINPNPTTPRTDTEISAVSRLTLLGVGWYE